MVRLCVAGGGLTSTIEEQIESAAQLHARGDIGAAAVGYRAVLALSPQHPEALHMLSVIALQRRNLPFALTLADNALAAQPAFPRAHFQRSLILRMLGRSEEALQAAHEAKKHDPNLAEAWDMIGQILKDKGDYNESAAHYVRAIQLQPGNPHFYGNYALLLQTAGFTAEAYRAAAMAESLDPSYPPMLLGNLLKALGYPEQAAARFARTRALRPDFADAAASEAMARLQTGDMEQGWKIWEQRPDFAGPLAALPLWQGQKVTHLLLYEDQGLGDAIQFLRYIPLLRSRADKITLRLREPLRRLCAGNFPAVTIDGEDAPPPPADARCRLSSLPYFFTTRLDTVPAAPYLTAPQERREFWRNRLQNLPAPRIGIVWAGNSHFRNDAARSLALSALQPVFSGHTPHFVAIQKDRPGESASAGIFDAAPQLADFTDTAALIGELDLVIAVDTATAHLAGALGKPVFILLPFDSDWRWFLGREDSPWYKTARLFRQKKTGDWTIPIERLAMDVHKFIAGDHSVLNPTPWRGESLRQNPDALSLPS